MSTESNASLVSCTVSDPARLAALRAFQILDTEFEEAFDDIVRIAATACNAPISLISFVDEHRQWFKARVGFNQRETPLDSSMCRHALLEDDVMIINDTLLDQRSCTNPLALAAERPIRFYAGATLRANGQPLGSLCVLDYTPRTLSDSQIQVLKLLRNQVVRFMEYRSMNLGQQNLLHELDATRGALQRMAQTDPLTGLLNRHTFDAHLANLLHSRTNSSKPITLMVIDIDHFKKINDTHGHLVGDQVLVETAGVLRQALRENDILCRWGGEEFVTLLPGLDLTQTSHIANRIRQSLTESPIDTGDALISVTASIGLTVLRSGEQPDDALKRADQAMYQAKAQGRNCTVAA